MTVAVQVPRAQVTAAVGQTVFPFAWRCDDAVLVAVWVDDAQVGGSGIALNADQIAAPGGTATLAIPCLGGEVVTVERTSPQQQTTVLTRYGPFTADIITRALDRMVMLSQEAVAIFLDKCLRVRRSSLAKMLTLELPAPLAGTALGWATLDAGAHWKIDNVAVGGGGIAGVNGILVKNEIPAGAVSSTDGTDGNGVFVLLHAPLSDALLDFYIAGIRTPPPHYTRIGAVVTFNAGYKPIAGSYICADYFY